MLDHLGSLAIQLESPQAWDSMTLCGAMISLMKPWHTLSRPFKAHQASQAWSLAACGAQDAPACKYLHKYSTHPIVPLTYYGMAMNSLMKPWHTLSRPSKAHQASQACSLAVDGAQDAPAGKYLHKCTAMYNSSCIAIPSSFGQP